MKNQLNSSNLVPVTKDHRVSLNINIIFVCHSTQKTTIYGYLHNSHQPKHTQQLQQQQHGFPYSANSSPAAAAVDQICFNLNDVNCTYTIHTRTADAFFFRMPTRNSKG